MSLRQLKFKPKIQVQPLKSKNGSANFDQNESGNKKETLSNEKDHVDSVKNEEEGLAIVKANQNNTKCGQTSVESNGHQLVNGLQSFTETLSIENDNVDSAKNGEKSQAIEKANQNNTKCGISLRQLKFKPKLQVHPSKPKNGSANYDQNESRNKEGQTSVESNVHQLDNTKQAFTDIPSTENHNVGSAKNGEKVQAIGMANQNNTKSDHSSIPVSAQMQLQVGTLSGGKGDVNLEKKEVPESMIAGENQTNHKFGLSLRQLKFKPKLQINVSKQRNEPEDNPKSAYENKEVPLSSAGQETVSKIDSAKSQNLLKTLDFQEISSDDESQSCNVPIHVSKAHSSTSIEISKEVSNTKGTEKNVQPAGTSVQQSIGPVPLSEGHNFTSIERLEELPKMNGTEKNVQRDSATSQLSIGRKRPLFKPNLHGSQPSEIKKQINMINDKMCAERPSLEQTTDNVPVAGVEEETSLNIDAAKPQKILNSCDFREISSDVETEREPSNVPVSECHNFISIETSREVSETKGSEKIVQHDSVITQHSIGRKRPLFKPNLPGPRPSSGIKKQIKMINGKTIAKEPSIEQTSDSVPVSSAGQETLLKIDTAKPQKMLNNCNSQEISTDEETEREPSNVPVPVSQSHNFTSMEISMDVSNTKDTENNDQHESVTAQPSIVPVPVSHNHNFSSMEISKDVSKTKDTEKNDQHDGVTAQPSIARKRPSFKPNLHGSRPSSDNKQQRNAINDKEHIQTPSLEQSSNNVPVTSMSGKISFKIDTAKPHNLLNTCVFEEASSDEDSQIPSKESVTFLQGKVSSDNHNVTSTEISKTKSIEQNVSSDGINEQHTLVPVSSQIKESSLKIDTAKALNILNSCGCEDICCDEDMESEHFEASDTDLQSFIDMRQIRKNLLKMGAENPEGIQSFSQEISNNKYTETPVKKLQKSAGECEIKKKSFKIDTTVPTKICFQEVEISSDEEIENEHSKETFKKLQKLPAEYEIKRKPFMIDTTKPDKILDSFKKIDISTDEDSESELSEVSDEYVGSLKTNEIEECTQSKGESIQHSKEKLELLTGHFKLRPNTNIDNVSTKYPDSNISQQPEPFLSPVSKKWMEINKNKSNKKIKKTSVKTLPGSDKTVSDDSLKRDSEKDHSGKSPEHITEKKHDAKGSFVKSRYSQIKSSITNRSNAVYGSKSIRSYNKKDKPKLAKRSKRATSISLSTYGKMCSKVKEQLSNRFGKKDPDSTKLKMLDLIVYNPPRNRMPRGKKNTSEDQQKSDKCNKPDNNPIIDESASEEKRDKENEEQVPLPQLKLSSDGEMGLSHNSLVVEQSLGEISSDIEILAGKYKQRKSKQEKKWRQLWSHEETVQFYEVLHTVGADFTEMAKFFPDRSRDILKSKFKREEKARRDLIEKVLHFHGEFNIEEMKKKLNEENSNEPIGTDRVQLLKFNKKCAKVSSESGHDTFLKAPVRKNNTEHLNESMETTERNKDDSSDEVSSEVHDTFLKRTVRKRVKQDDLKLFEREGMNNESTSTIGVQKNNKESQSNRCDNKSSNEPLKSMKEVQLTVNEKKSASGSEKTSAGKQLILNDNVPQKIKDVLSTHNLKKVTKVAHNLKRKKIVKPTKSKKKLPIEENPTRYFSDVIQLYIEEKINRKETSSPSKSAEIQEQITPTLDGNNDHIVINTNIVHDNVKYTQYITFNSNNLENPVEINETISH